MSRSRKMRSPPTMAMDSRIMDRPRLPDFDDPYGPPPVMGVLPPQPQSAQQALPSHSQMASLDMHHPHHPGYPQHSPHMPPTRDRRALPSSYRESFREPHHSLPQPPQPLMPQPVMPQQHPQSAPYKILCITNLNPKISDNAVKEALSRDFSRYGEISVSICHDSGERLAYIYFRYYEEAREARYAKIRTLFFDKPIEIEPIYEQRSPLSSPSATYTRRRSITPPDYYGLPNGPHPSQMPPHRSSRPPYGYRPGSPSSANYLSRTPPHHYSGPSYRQNAHPPMPPIIPPSPHGPPSPYMTPTYDYHTSYYSPSSPHHLQYSPNHPYPHLSPRESDYYRRSPRHDPTFYDYRHPPSPRGPSNYNYPMHPGEYSNRYTSPPGMHHSHRSVPGHQQAVRDDRRNKRSSRAYDDDRPTKTIFISNLDPSSTDSEVMDIFKIFGAIEDMEIRRPAPAISYANAFVRYTTIEMAQRAKIEMNNRFIGKYQCKISYGTTFPSKRLWIGGLGPWVDPNHLEDEFARFGPISSIDYNPRRPFAYIEFDNIEHAKKAYQKMKGFTFFDKRIRVEYAENDSRSPDDKLVQSESPTKKSENDIKANQHDWDSDMNKILRKRSASPIDIENKRKPVVDVSRKDDCKAEDDSIDQNDEQNSSGHTSKIENGVDKLPQFDDEAPKSVPSNCQISPSTKSEDSISIKELTETCSVSWQSSLVLKNCGFLSKMFLCTGSVNLIEKYITKLGEESKHPPSQLKINQRLRLHQPKLDEVARKMQSEKNCMFVIVSDQSRQAAEKAGGDCGKDFDSVYDQKQNGHDQSKESEVSMKRPLRNLVSYLKQKDAAGIVSLMPLDVSQDGTKLLYIFPPCSFSNNLIRQARPNLTSYLFKEEYLLGIIVRGN